jgi:UDP-2,4-diacetamido-2,4,6-trideoxy-beta-L-altropyranose hydrolase
MLVNSKINIAFRTDASIQIGTGHVMRCLSLADALSERGARCTFICRPHIGNLIDEVVKRGHYTKILPKLPTRKRSANLSNSYHDWLGIDWHVDAEQTSMIIGSESFDWLIVDHYGLDQKWEQKLKVHYRNLLVIDDLADRYHDCNILLDQNLGREQKDYIEFLGSNSIKYIGPKYALLRPEFAQLREESLARRVNPQFKRLLISLGGVDKDNATGKVLQVLTKCKLPIDLKITIVMGSHAPYIDEVKVQSKLIKRNIEVLVDVKNMAQLMVESDVCIGAAGSTSWERCCLGLPSILLVLAPNQLFSATALSKVNAIRVIDINDLANSLPIQIQELSETQNLKELVKSSKKITKGLGTNLIVDKLLSIQYIKSATLLENSDARK